MIIFIVLIMLIDFPYIIQILKYESEIIYLIVHLLWILTLILLLFDTKNLVFNEIYLISILFVFSCIIQFMLIDYYGG